MQRAISFSCSYSAKDNSEIQEIRRKYLPQTDSKMEELKRLDRQGQKAGIAYPIYSKVYKKTKDKLAPRILYLTTELIDE